MAGNVCLILDASRKSSEDLLTYVEIKFTDHQFYSIKDNYLV